MKRKPTKQTELTRTQRPHSAGVSLMQAALQREGQSPYSAAILAAIRETIEDHERRLAKLERGK